MTKHEYICAVCRVVAAKSDCFKRKVGAVFVNEDHEILATGYNAPPRGFAHCDVHVNQGDVLDRSVIGTCGTPCFRNIHAEMNAITQAAKRGTALSGSILYCSYLPCVDCARLLVNLNIDGVLIEHINNDGGGPILSYAGIAIFTWEETLERNIF